MRRAIWLPLVALAFVVVAALGAGGCEVKEKTNFCELYMRCIGFDPKAPGCHKNMSACQAAFGAEEFSKECTAKGKSLVEKGVKRPSEYCTDLCTVCD